MDRGVLILLGVAKGDNETQCAALAKKCAELRIFSDAADKMNLSLQEIGGGALVVSQFTLLADTTGGRRPYFGGAETPQRAEDLYLKFVERLRLLGVPTQTGAFGKMMQVELCNDGPVTIVIDV